jgi:chemotaxis response regulator CheB
MEPTRVLLVGLPALLRDLVEQALSEAPELELVGEADEESGFEAALETTGAELVIATSEEGEVADRGRDALEARASLRVLALEKDGARASLWRLRIERVDVGEVTPETLPSLLRSS